MNKLGSAITRRQTDDEGFTLVELMVAMVIFSILIVMTLPVISTFYTVDSSITNTVGTVGQILPATTVLGRYVRSAVAPAPGGIPPFAPIGSPAAAGYPSGTLYQAGTNQMSFYSNTGDQVASGSLQGDAVGPRLVTLTVSGPTGRQGYTLTLQSTKAVQGTCPGSSPAMSQTSGATCSYAGQPAVRDFAISYVTNGSQSDPNPIFQYIVGITTTGLPNVVTPGNAPSGWTCGTYSCVPVSAAALVSVTGVQIDMETQQTIGSLTSFRTTVLFFSPNYSTNVG